MKFYHAPCNIWQWGKDQFLLLKNICMMQRGKIALSISSAVCLKYDQLPFVISVIYVAGLQHMRNDLMYNFETQKWTTYYFFVFQVIPYLWVCNATEADPDIDDGVGHDDVVVDRHYEGDHQHRHTHPSGYWSTSPDLWC